MEIKGDDFKILSDAVNDGVRHITAATSALVCSRQIDFDIIDGKVYNLTYVRGCEGNLRAIGRLVDGMAATDVARILAGVDCHGRGTSCTDQLSRVMAKVLG